MTESHYDSSTDSRLMVAKAERSRTNISNGGQWSAVVTEPQFSDENVGLRCYNQKTRYYVSLEYN